MGSQRVRLRDFHFSVSKTSSPNWIKTFSGVILPRHKGHQRPRVCHIALGPRPVPRPQNERNVGKGRGMENARPAKAAWQEECQDSTDSWRKHFRCGKPQNQGPRGQREDGRDLPAKEAGTPWTSLKAGVSRRGWRMGAQCRAHCGDGEAVFL